MTYAGRMSSTARRPTNCQLIIGDMTKWSSSGIGEWGHGQLQARCYPTRPDVNPSERGRQARSRSRPLW